MTGNNLQILRKQYLATSDSRAARLSDKVSSLQATVDYMTTLVEQLSEKAQSGQSGDPFESVQVEAFENQVSLM